MTSASALIQNDALEEWEIVEILKNDVGHDGFELEEFTEKPASDSPLGFLGDHCKVRVVATVCGHPRVLHYFVKRMPSKVPQHRTYAVEVRAFYKETELYKTLFVDFRNAQSDVTGRTTKWHPKYFYARGTDAFVLEDLSVSGYYMYPERCLLDEEHTRASLSAMAAMHAASVVFETKFNRGKVKTVSPNRTEPGNVTLGQIYSHLTFETEFSDQKGHIGHTFLEAGIASQVKIAQMLSDYSAEEKRKITEKLPDALRRVYQLVKPSDRFRNVFVHGDLWSNNFLYSKNENGRVRDALIIDYQLARYAPPAHEVMMFLYLCQDKNFLDVHEMEMLKHYHGSFADELYKNSIQVEDVLPWEIFLESCHYYRDLGLLMRLFYFQLTLAPPEITTRVFYDPDEYTQAMLVDRTDVVLECFNTDDLYRRRVTEAMKEVIERLILNENSSD